jgi:GNAT superfamily N-acetyltransferase
MEITVYYLQMFSRPQRTVPPPRDGLLVLHAVRPTVPYYRFLYDAVGRPWQWLSRRKLTDEQLAAVISDPKDEVHVLHVDGVPAGFAEFDRRTEGEIELVQFGLTSEFIGQGLGKWFLHWTIERAWSYGPKRLWLHTCTLDHPNALPNYRKAGFELYKQEIQVRQPFPA